MRVDTVTVDDAGENAPKSSIMTRQRCGLSGKGMGVTSSMTDGDLVIVHDPRNLSMAPVIGR